MGNHSAFRLCEASRGSIPRAFAQWKGFAWKLAVAVWAARFTRGQQGYTYGETISVVKVQAIRGVGAM